MAKIDVSKIEGYAEMSAEDKLKALEEFEFEDPSDAKLKAALSKASSDAAEWKRKYRETQSEQERKEAETAELIEKMKAQNEELMRTQKLAEHTSQFMSVGFSEDMAKKAAEAVVGGDFTAMTTTLKDFITAHDKERDAEALRKTPRPGNGGSGNSVTKEQFDKMKYAERVKLFEENPELYKELTK